FDLLAGSTTAPYLNIKKKPNFGPLQDAQLLIDTKTLRPGTRVRAFVVTFTADPQKSTFVWYHNGARVASGKGKTFYEFTLGQLGSTETIRVVVDSNAGTSRELTKTIRPARIHFSWFTDSYTPPWYRGKALPSPGSTIIVSAFPDLRIGTTRLDPKSLIYEWSVNDTQRPRDSGESGYGKNVFTLRTQVIGARSFTIGVTVKDERERVVHTESTQIAIQSPNMLFYERDALLGTRFERIADRALAKSGGDFLIEFEPYFLPRGIFDTLRINWAVNGERLGNVTRDNRTLRLTTEDGGFGQQVVSATYENAENIFQRGSAQTIITVGQP
ncbi:MAG: hypothetical protein HY470_01290, partial [Candidatus Ryanbacteria bacterium]|nr:hypothetical protein [Candidatus Ryanbacteria bacterium]